MKQKKLSVNSRLTLGNIIIIHVIIIIIIDSSIEKSYNEEMEVLQEKIKTLENELAQKSDDRPGVGKELKAGLRKSVVSETNM